MSSPPRSSALYTEGFLYRLDYQAGYDTGKKIDCCVYYSFPKRRGLCLTAFHFYPDFQALSPPFCFSVKWCSP